MTVSRFDKSINSAPYRTDTPNSAASSRSLRRFSARKIDAGTSGLTNFFKKIAAPHEKKLLQLTVAAILPPASVPCFGTHHKPTFEIDPAYVPYASRSLQQLSYID